MKVLTQKKKKKIQDHVPCSFAYQLVCVDDEFTKPILVFRVESAAYKLIEAILKEYEYWKKVIKKILTKIWSWVKKKNDSNRVTFAGFQKSSLIMTMKS